MKVLLLHNVPGLGVAGKVKEVADGYARNYLLPKGLAVIATEGTIKTVVTHKQIQDQRDERLAERASELIAKISALQLTFYAKAGPKGRLYGSITTADIAQELEKKLGVPIDRRKIACEPLRQVGEHVVPVRLGHQAEAHLRVIIQTESGAEEAAAPAETARPAEG